MYQSLRWVCCKHELRVPQIYADEHTTYVKLNGYRCDSSRYSTDEDPACACGPGSSLDSHCSPRCCGSNQAGQGARTCRCVGGPWPSASLIVVCWPRVACGRHRVACD